MNKEIKAFSLIEVIIATGILSLTFFGVYKLIGENTKIISNSANYTTANSLFLPFKECIKNNSGATNMKNTDKFYINLNNCSVNSTKVGIEIDSIDYILFGSGKADNSYDLSVIFDGIKLKKNFILK